MKLNVSFTPDLIALMRAEVAAGQKAVSITMAQAGTSLKSAWRAQITGAGLGQRLANTIRSQTLSQGSQQPRRGHTGLVERPGHHWRA